MEDKNNLLFQIERRNQIMTLLHNEGKIYVTDLQQKFGVSGATIRSDLNELEADGQLTRTHGGAVEKTKTAEDTPLEVRYTRKFEQKLAIAVKAVELISDGDSLMVDGGSTLAQFITELSKSNKSDLTVITNFVPHIYTLRQCENIKTMMVGGMYDSRLQSTIGLNAAEFVKKYRTDKVIMSATGISEEHGITYAQSQDAEIKHAMIEQGKTKILLTDSAKIGQSYFATAGSLSQMDILVTDWDISEESYRRISELGMKVIVAPRVN